jgi:hypothetical protein
MWTAISDVITGYSVEDKTSKNAIRVGNSTQEDLSFW